MRCNAAAHGGQFNRRKALQLNFKMFVIDRFVEAAIVVANNQKKNHTKIGSYLYEKKVCRSVVSEGVAVKWQMAQHADIVVAKQQ